MTAGGIIDGYVEGNLGGASEFYDDDTAGGIDPVRTDPASPSQPASNLDHEGPGKGDDSFLDVIIYVDAP